MNETRSCTTCAHHDPFGSLETAPQACYVCYPSGEALSQWKPISLLVTAGTATSNIPPMPPPPCPVGSPTPMPSRPAYYTALAITPFEYAMRNKLDAMQFSVVKYVTRFRDKGGVKDLRKAQDCLEQLIKHEEANAKQAK